MEAMEVLQLEYLDYALDLALAGQPTILFAEWIDWHWGNKDD